MEKAKTACVCGVLVRMHVCGSMYFFKRKTKVVFY